MPFFIVRSIFLVIILGGVLYGAFSNFFPTVFISLLSFLLIFEIFIKFGLENISPKISLDQNPKDIFDSFTKEALESTFFKIDTNHFIKTLMAFPQSKFFLEKATITNKEFKIEEVDQMELILNAEKITRKLKGKYITTTDLLISYFILTEEKTKVLFDNKLKEKDILNIAVWTKIIFKEEFPKNFRARFSGIGLGEALIYGWTPETKKYTSDHTFSNIKRKSTIEGRESEYKRLLEAMQKDQNNNVLLVGDLGSGKSNLVENFIYESYESNLPKKLNHRRFLELMIGPFVAGAENRSDLETRFQSIIEEVKHSGNIILYVPEFQNILGSSSYGIDLSGAMLPYLNDGKMPIIATMNHEQYKNYFEKNALRGAFEIIVLDSPTIDEAMKMLFQKTEEIELVSKVSLSYKALLSALEYANKYDPTGSLPGSAVDLLSDCANSIKVSKRNDQIVTDDDVIKKVSEKTKIPLGVPKEEEKDLLLNFEEKMQEFIIGQKEALRSISEAIRRIRSGIVHEKPISFLFLGPTGVGKTETAKTLAKLYFQGEVNIVRLDMSEYGREDSVNRLLSSGAESFMDKISNSPFSLVLLDEFEKADKKILNLFLQVFEDGRLTDSNGKTVSFNNTIIIATSNAGSEFIRQSLDSHNPIDNKTLLDFLQKNGIFTPELLNRFDDIVVFHPLNQMEINQVTQMMVNELTNEMDKQDIYLIFDPKAIDFIAVSGYNAEFGARPLRRFIQDNIEDALAKKILSGDIERGGKIKIGIDSSNNLTFNKAS